MIRFRVRFRHLWFTRCRSEDSSWSSIGCVERSPAEEVQPGGEST